MHGPGQRLWGRETPAAGLALLSVDDNVKAFFSYAVGGEERERQGGGGANEAGRGGAGWSMGWDMDGVRAVDLGRVP